MSRYDQQIKRGEITFFRKITSKNLITLVGAPDIDKAKIELRTLSGGKENNSVTHSVDIFMDVLALETLCRDILSGVIYKRKTEELAKGEQYPKAVFTSTGGSIRTMKARIFSIIPGSRLPYIIQGMEGKGKLNPNTGGITPDFKYNESDARIIVGLTEEEMKYFAIMGLRFCDFYYEHYFGRIDPETEDVYGRSLQNKNGYAAPEANVNTAQNRNTGNTLPENSGYYVPMGYDPYLG